MLSTVSGLIRKMRVECVAGCVNYYLPVSDEEIFLNPLLSQPIHLSFHGEIHCVGCGREIKKTFAQGYCYPCFQNSPQCDPCSIKPELCAYHQGTSRDPEWAKTHCLAPHIVYISNTANLKVGVTRKTNIPSRWVDQGACQAIALFEATERHVAGCIEVMFKQYISDKTAWQRMLKQNPQWVEMEQAKTILLQQAESELVDLMNHFNGEFSMVNESAWEIKYPILTYPTKVSSLSFDKTAEISGELQGIKGQYLILSTGVLNIRKFAGYVIECHY